MDLPAWCRHGVRVLSATTSAGARCGALAVLVVIASGCGREGGQAESVPSRPVRVRPLKVRSAPPPIFDSEGRLLPSDTVVAGHVMPRGIEPERTEGRVHRFRTDVPIAKLHQYFAPRVVTNEISPIGEGWFFRAATPREARRDAKPIDLTILPVAPRGATIEVKELNERGRFRTTEEALRHFNEELRRGT